MSTIITQDLRSDAKDHGRVKAHKSKWSKGTRHTSGVWRCNHELYPVTAVDCNDCDRRPCSNNSRNYTDWRQMCHKRTTARYNSMTKKAFRGTVGEAVDDAHDDLSDSSIDIDEISAAPELNEIMYSYDAPTGPSRGNDVLSHAIIQAVQRFENNETEKIVQTEYDLVLDGKDEPESRVADADDDFELIDGAQL